MTAVVVVNPRAGGGRTGRNWPRIRAGLETSFPQMQVLMSGARGHVAHLVRAALRDGHLDIIVVGGDGTINEAVNGFFDHGALISPDAVLGFIATGRGNDIARAFGLPAGLNGVGAIRRSHIRKVDLGRLSCLSFGGEPLIRYFLGGASFGFTARLARSRAPLGLGVMTALVGWHSPRLRLIADRLYDEIAGISLVAVSNGGWLKGTRIAEADPADGKFDILIAAGAPRRHLPKLLAVLGDRSHCDFRLLRAARLTAAPSLDTHAKVDIETDGESAGLLPATFDVLPAAINLRV
jgi:diacylglycerol kinase family enzyme